MAVGLFYIAAIFVVAAVLALIGDALAILTGYVHPWDFK